MLGNDTSILADHDAIGIGLNLDRSSDCTPVGRSKSPGYGHLKLPHLMIAVSAAEQQ
ncbi:hypothetical protein [Bradyrhizobium barranii]